MNILIIPEDFRKDQYILKPIFQKLVVALGSGSSRVRVCQDPLLGGVDEALKSSRIEEVIERYPMVHIFILCVDRDGRPGRRYRLDEIEAEFDATQTFLAENAWEELETWVLAGVDLPNNWNWSDVRGEIDVKELYFEPLVARLGLSDSPGGGRKALGEAASQRIRAIRQKCPEDFDSLACRLQDRL